MTACAPPGRGARPATGRAHALGVAWVLVAAGALVAPALVHGTSLGPIDWLSRYGLGQQPGVVVHNRQTLDQVTEMIPWTNLGWTQVHAGYLPLWNPYSGLGMPLAFNWQAASFSVPALVGYMVPLHLAYTAEILTALVVAGTGAYVLGAVLGLGALGCATAATVFELGGPLAGWLGWPVAWVMAWAGWLFAALVVAMRGQRRGRAVTVLALAVAATVYAGQPDMLVMLLVVAVLFVVAVALWSPAASPRTATSRSLIDVAAGTVGGAALAAPLLLPGAQLLATSVRANKAVTEAPASANLVHLVLQGFDGLPVAGSRWFGTFPYVRSAAYVGGIAVVLAGVGAMSAWRHRRRYPEAGPFVVVAVACAAVVFVPPVLSLATAVPGVRAVNWARAVLPLGFVVAVLAGVGADAVARAWDERWVRRAVGGGLALLAVALGAAWLLGRGTLPAPESSIRAGSFGWPVLATGAGLVIAALGLVAARRRGPVAEAGRPRAGPGTAVALLVVEAALLWGASAPLLSSSPTALAPTPAERALATAVGGGLVGLGDNACFTARQLGVPPNVNAAFGLDELGVYDPVLPRALHASWQAATGVTGAPPASEAVPFSLFCPAVDSVAVARRYGVAYILEPPGVRGPAGTAFVADVGGEGLYRVPGAARATLVDAATTGALPALDAPGAPVRVSAPEPTTWRLHTDAPGPTVLRLRVTAVPGWTATVDGHPLTLTTYAGVMLQARLGPGPHAVVLQYRPAAFVAGIWLAGAAVVVLVAVLVLDRRRRPRSGAGTAPA